MQIGFLESENSQGHLDNSSFKLKKMENCKTDNLTEEETTLLEDLKTKCEDGREKYHWDETCAQIFHKLGVLYFRRSKTCLTLIEGMFCLIRCAVLLNAALVRSFHETKDITLDLKQLHKQLLKSANAKQKDVDLCEKTDMVKLAVENMRRHVHQELDEIEEVTTQQSEIDMCEQELNKVKAIESLQNKITSEYIKIMADLAQECEQIMGKAPCKFAIIGMGSLARKEITPFSDFEHVIVLDSNFDGYNEKALNYFRWYSVIFQIIVINLGETLIPSVLNETNSELWSWFYDKVTKSGVSFDGTFPWACKYPLGRQQSTSNKEWKTELIKSVPDMLRYLNSKEMLKNGYHLGDILTKICYVYGDSSVYMEFECGMNNVLVNENQISRTEILNQIKDDLENFAIRSVLSKITFQGKYNVKKDVYRVTTLFISALGRLYKIKATSSFDIIQQLAESKKISQNARHNLRYAIAVACEIRLRWYMLNNKQKDEITDENATSKFLKIVGETSAINYFQIAYALQCDISKRFDLKKQHYYSQPLLLNISIYSSFEKRVELEHYIYMFDYNCSQQRLLEFDNCLEMLKIKPKQLTHVQLETAAKTERKKNISDKIFSIGQDLLQTNKLTDAKEYLEKALQLKKQSSSNVATDSNVAETLHEIGWCLIQMNKLTDAKEYLETALQIHRRVSSDVATDKLVATTLHSLGQCFLYMKKLSNAKECLEKTLQIHQQISTDIATDSNVAITLHSIGKCLIQMNELTDAREYLEKALHIHLRVSTDIATDSNVATALHSIGECLIDMNKVTDAKEYLEKALQIQQQISKQIDDGKIASIYLATCRCLIQMNELSDAEYYARRAMRYFGADKSHTLVDRMAAFTLCEIGDCLFRMKKRADAKEYFKKALRIQERISSKINVDRNVADTFHKIGQCLFEMKRPIDAVLYLESALDIYQQVSSNIAADRQMANTSDEINQCLIQINQLTEARYEKEKELTEAKEKSG